MLDTNDAGWLMCSVRQQRAHAYGMEIPNADDDSLLQVR